MLVIEAGPMAIHYKTNHSKQEQSLPEAQKTITIFDFILVSKLLAGYGKKAWCFVVYACPSCN